MTAEGPARRRLQPLCDKIGRVRIEQVVHAFYARGRAHPALQPHFARIADFDEHEARIVEFWWMAMGGRSRRPPVHDMVGRHRALGLGEEDFSNWLELFSDTLHDILPADLAGQWLTMAQGIAARLQQHLL